MSTPQVRPERARSQRRPGPKPRLSPELIVEAAFGVTERDGAQALTFQAIGHELKAHPTAIYRHFRDRDELILALLDRLHEESIAQTPAPSGDWVEDLRSHALATHAVFLQHPQIAQFAGVRTARSEHEFTVVDRVIASFRQAGFDDVQAARYYRVFADFILAYSAQDAALLALAPETRAGDLAAWDVEYKRVPADVYPNIAALTDVLPALDDPENFETALDLMLESLAARAERLPGHRAH